MLTMARQVGTALGIAVFGTVYLRHVHEELPQQLSALPQAQVAQLTTAAAHFQPIGAGEIQRVAQTVIVSGFVRTALAAAILCGLAAVAAGFIRHRLAAAEQPAPARQPGTLQQSRSKPGGYGTAKALS